MVKAAVLTIVERLHAAGYGLMYSGWPHNWGEVRGISAPQSWRLTVWADDA